MCNIFGGGGSRPATQTIAPPRIAAMDNREANRQSDLEARLRRRRAGAAANVLTSAVGVPAGGNPTLGSAV